MKIAVIGASGFVGSHLVPFLKGKGHEVFSIGRDLCVPKVDALINLAGANIFGKRWDAAYKREILESRLSVCETLKKCSPKVFLSASAIAAEDTFLASVVTEWEEAAMAVGAKRTVLMRFGVVLEPHGGALLEMAKSTKLFLGAKMGSGEQFISWISMKDLVRAIEFCLENKKMAGPVHFAAPHLVPQKRLIADLGRVLKRPILLTMPKFIARLLLGEAAGELLFASYIATPKELTGAGFTFDLPNVDAALDYYFPTAS
jgi:uncharacterized protein